MPVGDQVAILYCGTHALMSEISIEQVNEFQAQFLDRMRASHQDVLDKLGAGKIDADITSVIEETAAAVVATMV